MGRSNQLHSLQCLDTALGLPGLCCLCAESPDKVLHVRDLALLFVVVALLLREASSFQVFKRRVVTGKQLNALLVQVSNKADAFIQELPVM